MNIVNLRFFLVKRSARWRYDNNARTYLIYSCQLRSDLHSWLNVCFKRDTKSLLKINILPMCHKRGNFRASWSIWKKILDVPLDYFFKNLCLCDFFKKKSLDQLSLQISVLYSCWQRYRRVVINSRVGRKTTNKHESLYWLLRPTAVSYTHLTLPTICSV